MDIVAGDYRLEDVKRLNVVIGKNGSGKSTLLKAVDRDYNDNNVGHKKYITPERGGVLDYAPNIEQNMFDDPMWIQTSRRVNQFAQFRQQSVTQFRRLELSVLREAEGLQQVADFGPYVAKLNGLLDHVELRREEPTFKLYVRSTGQLLTSALISSGESELISVGIEILMFAKDVQEGRQNLLLLDEPDVHLHPDLQHRLAQFLHDLPPGDDIKVIIATHSTAFLGSLADHPDSAVAFMRSGEKQLKLESISDVHRRVLPVFGAHPLSNVFNEAPVLLVEGEDDERIWQTAVRTSKGKVRVYPVPCDGVSHLPEYEEEVKRIIAAVYDSATAYSLRDGDGETAELVDSGPLTRLRLSCRAAENLMLSDEVLTSEEVDWNGVMERLDQWIIANPGHPRHPDMVLFKEGGYDRKGHDLKDLRMLIVGSILNSTKPWEVLVGRVLGSVDAPAENAPPAPEGSLCDFLGDKTARTLLRSG